MIFGSAREAIAYLYAHHRGPTAARPKYHDAPGETGRSHWDGALLGAMLYGPRKLGCCGIIPGSLLDRQVREWATTAGVPRSDQVRAIDRRMRKQLHEAELLKRRERAPAARKWTDPEGRTWWSSPSGRDAR